MIRKTLQKTTKSKKLKEFLNKYNIPQDFLLPNRKMIARGVALGLFIAFIPMPMQMAATLLFMPFFRFNIAIAVAMVWITNPFTMPPIYIVEYYTGSFFLGTEVTEVKATLDWFTENIDNIFIPMYTGAIFYSISSSLLGYWVVNHFWGKSVKKAKKKPRKHR